MNMYIIPRRVWNARDCRKVNKLSHPVSYVMLTTTNNKPCFNKWDCSISIKNLQSKHMRTFPLPLPDIAYNFLIGGNGSVYEGRGWQTAPDLPKRYYHYKQNCLFIGFMGDYGVVEKVPVYMRDKEEELINFGMDLEMTFDIVPREIWGATDPLWSQELTLPVKYVFFELARRGTCNSYDTCLNEVKYLQNYNLNLRGNPDIRYNFIIGGDGTTLEGRGWRTVSRLPRMYESVKGNSLFIAFLGRTDPETKAKMFEARHKLLVLGVKNKYISPQFLEFNISDNH